MEVILREDVDKLGSRGQIVKVAAGYARNFLLPKKLAVEATGSNNTVTLDGAEHDDKEAGGILEGLTAPGFDYAAATSGPALRDATHVRSLWMVHGAPARPECRM